MQARVSVLCVCLLGLFLAGCAPSPTATSDVQVDLTLNPSPPKVGDANVLLKLTDSQGQPVESADVRVEGNMNHAGMKPSFAEMTEVEPGTYSGTLDFTMGGDWFLLVTATTAGGERVERTIDVPGVQVR